MSGQLKEDVPSGWRIFLPLGAMRSLNNGRDIIADILGICEMYCGGIVIDFWRRTRIRGECLIKLEKAGKKLYRFTIQ